MKIKNYVVNIGSTIREIKLFRKQEPSQIEKSASIVRIIPIEELRNKDYDLQLSSYQEPTLNKNTCIYSLTRYFERMQRNRGLSSRFATKI